MLQESIQVEDKRIDIYYPQNIEKERLPILYLLDGNAFGPLFDHALNLLTRNPHKTLVTPVRVISIGYNGEDLFHKEARFWDYTSKRKSDETDEKRKNFPLGGGSTAFRNQLAKIQEIIESKYKIDSKKIGLFGHSLGGLFVLETLCTANTLPFVTDYMAVSPSLWWNQFAWLDYIDKIEPQAKRVVIAVENDQSEMEQAARQAFYKLTKKWDDSQVSFYLGENENHMSIVLTSLSHLLRWFCKRENSL